MALNNQSNNTRHTLIAVMLTLLGHSNLTRLQLYVLFRKVPNRCQNEYKSSN